jgi:hypothetical protein
MPLATDRSCFLLAAALAAMASPGLRAIDVPLNRADMQRAVSLSRWPHSDAERARFHEPYTVRLDEAPVVDSWSAVQVEVITEFRRVELMGEQNAALGTLWGRAGVGDVEDAIRPWRGRVSIVARIGLRAEGIFVGPFPPVTLLLGESDAPAPLDTRRTEVYASCGELSGCPIVGGVVESIFDSASIAQTTRAVRVMWNQRLLARVMIDFAALE